MSNRNRACDCGSGKRYKHCCGTLTSPSEVPAATEPVQYEQGGLFPDHLRGSGMARFCRDLPLGCGIEHAQAPRGLAVVENFLSAQQCEELVSFLTKQPATDALVKHVDRYSGGVKEHVDQQRITKAIELGDMLETAIKYTVMAFRDFAVPYFSADLDKFEEPTALKYEKGGKFDAHADSEHWSDQENRWIRSQNRDYSILLYLNQGFTGGDISFPNLNITIAPKRGMLVTFPSDHRFMHAAEPLLSGERYVLVSWGFNKQKS